MLDPKDPNGHKLIDYLQDEVSCSDYDVSSEIGPLNLSEIMTSKSMIAIIVLAYSADHKVLRLIRRTVKKLVKFNFC